MLFGVALPNVGELADRNALVALAQAAEALGYHSVWTSEHLLLPPDDYPGLDSMESLTLLGFLAGHTERVRLGTSVLIAPLREPVLLAKQAATVQQLSGGRLTLGLGVGWLEAEFDLLGADFAGRGQHADPIIETLMVLLTVSPPPTNRPLSPVQAAFSPRVSRDVPLLIGGNSPAAQRRAAQRGDGWHAVWLEPQEIAAAIRALRGRPTRPDFEVSLRMDLRFDAAASADFVGLNGPKDAVAAKVLAYQEAGVDHLVIDPMNRDDHSTPSQDSILEQWAQFAMLVGIAPLPQGQCSADLEAPSEINARGTELPR